MRNGTETRTERKTSPPGTQTDQAGQAQASEAVMVTLSYVVQTMILDNNRRLW